MVADDEHRAFLVHERRLLRWTFAGYEAQKTRGDDVELAVLTPLSVVRAIAEGFSVGLHPSASTA